MKCTICESDIILQCNDNKSYKINELPVCRSCYFNELGKVIELYPIGIPISRDF